MRIPPLTAACITVAAALAAPASGDAASGDGTCQTRGVNGMVAAVLCPPGLSLEQWKAAGVAACVDRKPCGAWIWVDPAAVPAVIPEKHDDLSPEAVRNAKAIWINETGRLLVLDKKTSK